MTSTPLLLPFDGSPDALHAVRLLASWVDAAIKPVLFNVQPALPRFWPQPWVDDDTLSTTQLQQGEAVLAPARDYLNGAGMAFETQVRVGAIASSIVVAAATLHAAAIVMGTRGQASQLAPGSVALRVAQLADRPVIALRHDCRLPGTPGREARVLLAVDGSTHANAAARWLASARWLGKRQVEMAYVQPPLALIETMLGPRAQVVEHWSGQLGEKASERAHVALASAGIEHTLHTLSGEPATELARFAQDYDVDFIVLGTRGLGAVERALLGSTALQLAHISPVPLIWVP
jgi:nucleotide-binding universal stress UspA family protein